MYFGVIVISDQNNFFEECIPEKSISFWKEAFPLPNDTNWEKTRSILNVP